MLKLSELETWAKWAFDGTRYHVVGHGVTDWINVYAAPMRAEFSEDGTLVFWIKDILTAWNEWAMACGGVL
jgi:hypothetical protein